MTYFGARFGVLGVYVSGRTREKQTAITGEEPYLPAEVAAAVARRLARAAAAIPEAKRRCRRCTARFCPKRFSVRIAPASPESFSCLGWRPSCGRSRMPVFFCHRRVHGARVRLLVAR